MSSKPTVFAMHALVLLAVIAITPTPAVRGDDANVMSFSRQSDATSTPSAPTIVAQGRCYNGRCY